MEVHNDGKIAWKKNNNGPESDVTVSPDNINMNYEEDDDHVVKREIEHTKDSKKWIG